MTRPADLIRAAKHRWRVRRALAEIAARPSRVSPRPHGLKTPLVVSLTSYPARFGRLHHTLAALLCQTVAPDRVVLWIARDDMASLPRAVTDLAARGLEIAPCGDLRSYKKIVPALDAMPEATIVTADDDTYYGAGWLGSLVAAGAPVVANRAHRVALDPGGTPAPYRDWRRNIPQPETGPLVFPTGVGGVLYAPGTLHPDVPRRDLFDALAPGADDVWLYWMHRLCGSRPEKVGGPMRLIEWPGTQGTALRQANLVQSGNDRAIAALTARYGFPQPQ